MMDSLNDMEGFMETETDTSQELIHNTENTLLLTEQIKLDLNTTMKTPLTSVDKMGTQSIVDKVVSSTNGILQDSGSQLISTTLAAESGNTLVIPADELAQMLSLDQVEGFQPEQIDVGEELDTDSKSRMARLVPVPGSRDAYYLSYENTELPLEEINSIDKDSEREDLVLFQNPEEPEQLPDDSKVDFENQQPAFEQITTVEDTDHTESSSITEEPHIDEQSLSLGETSTQVKEENVSLDLKAEENASQKKTVKRKPKKVVPVPPLPDSVTFKEKVKVVSQHHDKLCQNYKVTKGIKRFSGAWKKPPKDDTLLKARFEVLKEIQQDFKQLCQTCFEEAHVTNETCPLLNPQWVIPNVEGGLLKHEAPDEILFGVSRFYPGLPSLFARDDIPAFTQFGPLKGKIVTMADLATMGVVKNDVNVSNLWPLPVENGLHEFELENFVYVKLVTETNWLKFVQVAPARDEENYPPNVQTVYKDREIYFVTTRDIEPGGELFLRAMEPPFRVHYNMHRLGEVDYDFCSRGKCKPENPTPENRHLKLHNLVNFVRHQLLVHTPQCGVFSWAAIYNCQQCGEDCFDKETFTRHNQEEHADMKGTKKEANVCRFCHLKCNSKNILYHHIRLQHPKEPHLNMYCCEICGKRFKNRDYLRHHHKSSHENEPTSCKLCHKTFQNPTKVRHHMRKVHLRPDQMKVCSECGAIYKDAWALKIHMKKHTQPFQKVSTHHHRKATKSVGTFTQEVMSQAHPQMMSLNVVHEDGVSQPSVFVSYVDELPEQQLITFRTGNGMVQTLLQ